MKSRGVDFAEVKRICQTCTLAGLEAMYKVRPSKPFRFLYISAEGTPRDMTQKPLFMGEYQLMRVRNYIPASLFLLVVDLNIILLVGRNGTHDSKIRCRA